jgi:poly(3-hydroxybutyrate) depolymerase
MTQRLACDAGDVFAAGASVSGGDINSPGIGGSCDAGATARPEGYEPVPLGFWHGTDDSVVRYDWGRTSLANWIERYQCGAPDEDTAAPYGPVEVYADCGRADVRARELATGTRVRLRFHTYTAHAHGYPDGCGGLGQAGASRCEPDTAAWPDQAFTNAEILDFLRAQPRANPAP